jgi:hypothetical protein
MIRFALLPHLPDDPLGTVPIIDFLDGENEAVVDTVDMERWTVLMKLHRRDVLGAGPFGLSPPGKVASQMWLRSSNRARPVSLASD